MHGLRLAGSMGFDRACRRLRSSRARKLSESARLRHRCARDGRGQENFRRLPVLFRMAFTSASAPSAFVLATLGTIGTSFWMVPGEHQQEVKHGGVPGLILSVHHLHATIAAQQSAGNESELSIELGSRWLPALSRKSWCFMVGWALACRTRI